MALTLTYWNVMGEADPGAIEQTVGFMRQFIPRTIYFTLHGKATEAELTDVIVVHGQSFRIRPLIRFGDAVFDNPCAVGKAMHQHLCTTHGYVNKPPRTFDGWNKLKVVIDALKADEDVFPHEGGIVGVEGGDH